MQKTALGGDEHFWVSFDLSGVTMDPQLRVHGIKQTIKYNPSLNTGAPKQSTSCQPQGQEGKTSKVSKATFKDKKVFLFSNVS